MTPRKAVTKLAGTAKTAGGVDPLDPQRPVAGGTSTDASHPGMAAPRIPNGDPATLPQLQPHGDPPRQGLINGALAQPATPFVPGDKSKMTPAQQMAARVAASQAAKDKFNADQATAAAARAAAATAAANATAWTPTGGIVDNIEGVTPEQVEGRGYTPTETPETQTYEAGGYNPETYTSERVTENVSDAVSRITGADSELLQREQAKAAQQANSRGLLNSSMAVQAGRAAVLDKATELAQGDVNVGMFNAQQSNEAKRFAAQAKNDAAGFLANAKNIALQFNSGESNKMAMFAVDQASLASRFAAEAENAASMFNAEAYNTAMQRYTDAKNAALAAQNDAINLSKRDTAQINASKAENDARNSTALRTAGMSANASRASAMISAETSRRNQSASIDAQMRMHGMSLTASQNQFIATMNSNQFNNYQNGLNAINLTELEPAARTNALHNYNSVWAATNYLPFNINMNAFPPATQPPR